MIKVPKDLSQSNSSHKGTNKLHGRAAVPRMFGRSVLSLIAGMVAIVAVGGCSVTKDYRAPEQAPVTLSGVQNSNLFTAEVPVGMWWSELNDPTLTKLITDALASNVEIRVAISRLQESRAILSEQRLDQLPHVIAGASYDRRNEQGDLPNERELTQTFSLGFDALWEVDIFGRQQRAIEGANAGMQARQADLRDVQVSVAAEVARNYFELRGLQKRVSIAQATLKNLASAQRLTEDRWRLGAGSELDFQSTVARYKEIESAIPVLTVLEAQHKDRLAVLLGLRPGALNERLAPHEAVTYARPLPIGDVSMLLRQRADVRAAERRLAAATAQVGVATADMFPRISITGFVGFLSGNTGSLLHGAGEAWAVTPALRWSALDLGSVRARLRATQARADGVFAQYEGSILNALQDAQQAVHSYGMRRERIVLVAERAGAARRAESLASIRFQEGSEDFLTFLDSERTRFSAEDALAQAEADVNVSVVAIYKALGGAGQVEQ